MPGWYGSFRCFFFNDETFQGQAHKTSCVFLTIARRDAIKKRPFDKRMLLFLARNFNFFLCLGF